MNQYEQVVASHHWRAAVEAWCQQGPKVEGGYAAVLCIGLCPKPGARQSGPENCSSLGCAASKRFGVYPGACQRCSAGQCTWFLLTALTSKHSFVWDLALHPPTQPSHPRVVAARLFTLGTGTFLNETLFLYSNKKWKLQPQTAVAQAPPWVAPMRLIGVM
jgi:hypothetical protein